MNNQTKTGTIEHIYLLRIPEAIKQQMTDAGVAWGQFKTGKVRQFILDAITEKLKRMAAFHDDTTE